MITLDIKDMTTIIGTEEAKIIMSGNQGSANLVVFININKNYNFLKVCLKVCLKVWYNEIVYI